MPAKPLQLVESQLSFPSKSFESSDIRSNSLILFQFPIWFVQSMRPFVPLLKEGLARQDKKDKSRAPITAVSF